MNYSSKEKNKNMQESVTKFDKLAYSVEEISAQTTLSKAFVRNEITAGRLKAQRFGRRVLVLNEDLQNYLRKVTNQNNEVTN